MNIKLKHKYGAVRTTIDGTSFASKKEANRYLELKMFQKSGQITDLVLQPSYVLQEGFCKGKNKVRPIKYIADFQYMQNGKLIVEDTKGVETANFKLKRKMFWFRYPDVELLVF